MMLVEKVSKDLTEAMKAREQVKLSALRMVKAALMNAEVAKGRALEEPEAQQVLTSLLKQRRDSIEQFAKGGRQDLVAREAAEVTLLETYLPPAVDAAEVEKAVDKAIAETGASSPKDLGRVMKTVMTDLAGRTVDGKVVNELVRRRLSG